MKFKLLILLLAAVLLTPSPARPSGQTSAAEVEWPREMASADGTRWTVFQPQINTWEDHARFDGWMAVSTVRAGQQEPVVGALHFTADTKTNLEERTVIAYNLQIVEANFPALDEVRTMRMVQAAQSLLPEASREMALDRVLAHFDRADTGRGTIELSTDPPTILVSNEPAVLVLLDGEPIMSPVNEELSLRFAVNTNWDLFREGESGPYYLRNDDAWLAANDYRGPWQAAGRLPDSFTQLPATDNWTAVRNALPPRPLTGEPQPAVLISTVPTELILIDGEPETTTIGGTRLSFVADTDSDLYFHSGDANYYYLVAGRWFRAASLAGPWTFASRDLPDDFAQIPADHERGEILYTVPGTPQAQEALILSQIPETAVVNRGRAAATVDVSYAGDLEFEPIEGTDLAYAVNTAFDVIRVADDEYYVNFEGVWFTGSTAAGPWQVADSIPAEIYSIPATSPVHNTTYCEVEESSNTSVTFAISAGYWGVHWGYGSVYFGTGWYWPPYYYGVGAWYNPYSGRYGRSAAVYGPYGGYGRSASYNPRTGAPTRAAPPPGARTAPA